MFPLRLWKKTGMATFSFLLVFSNRGTVNINKGSLTLNKGSVIERQVSVSSGSQLDFLRGTHFLVKGATIAGPGYARLMGGIVGGRVEVQGAVVIDNFEQRDGRVTNDGTMEINGT